MNEKQLIEEAKKAREKAYAPYSTFKVGAAFLQQMEKCIMVVMWKMLPIVCVTVQKEQLYSVHMGMEIAHLLCCCRS